MWPFTKKSQVAKSDWHNTKESRWAMVKETSEYRLEQQEEKYVDMNNGTIRWSPIYCYFDMYDGWSGKITRLIKKDGTDGTL